MSQANASATKSAAHQRERVDSEARQASTGPEVGAQVVWGGLARGGVAAPPLPPPGVVGGGAPRGLRRAGAGYVLQLQRVHGNLQTARLIAGERQAAVGRPIEVNGNGPAAGTVAGSLELAGPAPSDRAGSDLGWGAIRRFPAPAVEQECADCGDEPAGVVARAVVGPASGVTGRPVVQRGIWDSIVGGVRAVGNLAAQGASFLFEQALRLAGVPADLLGILRRAGSAFDRIVADPMGFLRNLLDAVMGGFRRFGDNIRTHIVNGLIGWLTGALGGAGIRLPQRFDLAGIFDLALQILGLTADRIRQKIGRVIGEQNVRRIEAVWNVVSNLIQNGLGGLWNVAREFLGNLQEMVLGPVKEWAITQIIQQGVHYVVSLFNPAGAIAQAIRMIWNVIQFLRARGPALFAIFTRVIESIAAIASGNLGGAVNAIEQTLARAIPTVLDLLARLLGLGDVAAPIRRAIDAIRQPVDRAIDRVIGAIARGIRGAVGAVRGLLGGRGGRSGAAGQAASQEQEQDRQRRLQQGVGAGVAAFNRFRGRPVGERILRPLLAGIRLRYRLAVLEPVVQGDRWAIRGEISRMTVPTEVQAAPAATEAEIAAAAGSATSSRARAIAHLQTLPPRQRNRRTVAHALGQNFVCGWSERTNPQGRFLTQTFNFEEGRRRRQQNPNETSSLLGDADVEIVADESGHVSLGIREQSPPGGAQPAAAEEDAGPPDPQAMHYTPGPAGAFDRGVAGQYSGSHAEKQAFLRFMFSHQGSAIGQPIGVSRVMCSDCQAFFRAKAQEQQRVLVVADPDAVRVFKPDGTVETR